MKPLVLALFLSTPAFSVPWTTAGGGFYFKFIRDVCGVGSEYRCEIITPGNIDGGYRVLGKFSGLHFYDITRDAAEQIQQDYALAQNKAEEHRPESMFLARKEAEISQLEYINAACAAGGVYCTGMASRLDKYKELFMAGCAGWLGYCQAVVKEAQAERRKIIDFVKAQCALNDQACFDAVTGGGETQARVQSSIEKSSGARPPHVPPGPADMGRPLELAADGTWVYPVSCAACTITDY